MSNPHFQNPGVVPAFDYRHPSHEPGRGVYRILQRLGGGPASGRPKKVPTFRKRGRGAGHQPFGRPKIAQKYAEKVIIASKKVVRTPWTPLDPLYAHPCLGSTP